MENKTAMMQLRDELKQIQSQSIMYPGSLDVVFELIDTKYLAIEKQLIKNDYWSGVIDLGEGEVYASEQYYNETYGK